MADKMLIDATHPEETRVVVLRGNRVEEFDFESAHRKQLRGNIYLAKVTRVEPSLQAAFVDYGGNRHGFLAFSEIHPDYYQIPVADRQALLAEEARAQRDADDEADNRSNRRGGRHRRRGANRRRDVKRSQKVASEEQPAEVAELPPDEQALAATAAAAPETAEGAPDEPALTAEQAVHEADFPPEGETVDATPAEEAAPEGTAEPAPTAEGEQPADIYEPTPAPAPVEAAAETAEAQEPEEAEAAEADEHAEEQEELGEEAEEDGQDENEEDESEDGDEDEEPRAEAAPAGEPNGDNGNGENGNGEEHEEEAVESVGGADALEEAQERLPRFRRNYKIQEVIKRRQVMLVQVVKEERGTKGAALTTYLSLAGRYSVLMPNTARGGGISRKITNSEDRSRLKEIASELEVPEGMGVILRTAGAARTKTEVKRDFEYLLRLWETVRDLTLNSTAPTLVYEEGSLVKRSIRDLYTKDIDEIVVAGDDGYKEARDFMRMLMPSHVKHVKQYKDGLPLFTRYGIESQLDAMFSPVVQLKSGGYIVLNQTEALVAIDVNSGRATREHHIEDTATKTNVEAAEEVARQLRLRDLAGLIVIDFIDMDEGRNNRQVERKLKEALKHDRARIQVGRISHFGLLEMSRQRIRASVLESSTEKCPVCGGSGHVRSVSSVALQALRAVEETLIKGATHNLIVRTRSEVALYMLNHKRAHLRELEERFQVTITVSADDTVTGQQSYLIDRGEQMHSAEAARHLAAAAKATAPIEEEAYEPEPEAEAEEAQGEGGRRKRRRRGRGRGRGAEAREEGHEEGAEGSTHETAAEHAVAHEDHDDGAPEEFGGEEGAQREEAEEAAEGEEATAAGENGERDGRRRRRRGRRGGRRNRRGRDGEESSVGAQAASGPYENGEGEAEPELQHAVEDMDRPAVWGKGDEPQPTEQPEQPEQPMSLPTAEAEFPAPVGHDAPEAIEAEAEAEAAEEAEAAQEAAQAPQRRRSTVRERAPIAIEGEPRPPSPTLPPPAPVISVSSSDEPSPPKRGWWGKRILGDKD
jgi:ribonuclease E